LRQLRFEARLACQQVDLAQADQLRVALALDDLALVAVHALLAHLDAAGDAQRLHHGQARAIGEFAGLGDLPQNVEGAVLHHLDGGVGLAAKPHVAHEAVADDAGKLRGGAPGSIHLARQRQRERPRGADDEHVVERGPFEHGVARGAPFVDLDAYLVLRAQPVVFAMCGRRAKHKRGRGHAGAQEAAGTR